LCVGLFELCHISRDICIIYLYATTSSYVLMTKHELMLVVLLSFLDQLVSIKSVLLFMPLLFLGKKLISYVYASAWGYNWATLYLGDINTQTWLSRFWVGRKADDLPLQKKSNEV
jgi:hypothetical protein